MTLKQTLAKLRPILAQHGLFVRPRKEDETIFCHNSCPLAETGNHNCLGPVYTAIGDQFAKNFNSDIARVEATTGWCCKPRFGRLNFQYVIEKVQGLTLPVET